jgi:PleD family two-component response regulator
MASYESAYDKSITDFLTQAHNRAFFDDYLLDTVRQSRKYGEIFSVGVTEYADTDDSVSLVKRADNALLLAKQRGKNRVEFL